MIGFLSMENGLFFAATVATYGMPMVVELGIALDVLIGVLILGVFMFQIREQFDSLDIRHLEKLKDELTWRRCLRARHPARRRAPCSALIGHRDNARDVNVAFSLGTFLAACVLTAQVIVRRPAARLGPRVLHRRAERLPGHADRLRRPDDLDLLAALHARGARPRQDDAGAAAPVPQHVPAVQLHDAAGADDQQPGHPVGRDGGGDADDRAAGQRLPHRRQPGGGVEVLHPVRRGHRAGAVRHRAALHGGGEGPRRRGRRAAVDQPRRGEGPARPEHHHARLRLPVHRLRHQGRPGAAAQLAARRPRRRSDAGLGRALGPAAQRRAVRGRCAARC